MYAQRELDDATVEAVLRGGHVPADLEPLAAALGTLRELQEQPVRPSAELAARMATGDFASAVAPRPSRRSAGRHVARRRLATLPLRAKVAAGSVLALGGLASATAAGALPDEAQERIETVIEAVTPFEFNHPNEFGQDVSDDARDGGVDGHEVSERAKEHGNQLGEPDVAESPEPAVVPPAGRSNTTPPASQPAENPGGAGKPAEQGQPDEVGPADKGKSDDAGRRPDESPTKSKSTD
ncbi:MAG TPA: hypothetical protein VFZ63_18500 [Jiangellaceae bacterium]